MNIDLLVKIADEIRDKELRELVRDMLLNPRLSFTDAKPLIEINESPAAPRKHHFFTGGLIIHTYIVASVALHLSRLVEDIYGLKPDQDIVLATALLHDIFKYYQYAPDSIMGGYKPREDWYLAHDYAVIAELARRGAPDKLIRAVSEVHGQVPFTTIEGLIVHLADSMDAKLGEYLQSLVLARIKEFERQCIVFKALDDLIKRDGLASTVSTAIQDTEEFKRKISEICRAQTSNQ